MTSATGAIREPLRHREITELTLGSSPARELASEVDTDDLGALQLPGKTSHNIDRISTTDTASNHAKTTSVRGVRVGTDHKTTGESVVLEDNLVDDTRARLPETETVLDVSQ